MTQLPKALTLFVISASFIVSTSTFAQQPLRSCLSAATNNQLVNELGRRLNVGPVNPGGNFDMAITCKGSDLRIEVLDLAAGQILKELSYNLYGDSKCQDAAASMLVKVPRIKQGGILAFCKSSDLYRLFVSQEGTITVKSENLYSDSKCFDNAQSINSN